MGFILDLDRKKDKMTTEDIHIQPATADGESAFFLKTRGIRPGPT